MKKVVATGIFAVALALLLATSAQAALADEVTIKSVDNYGGNSNIYTDKFNTTVTVSSLDADGKVIDT